MIMQQKGAKMNWNWKLLKDGTLQIYNGNSLYWEVDCCNGYSEEEQKAVAMEFINNYKSWIAE